MHFPAQDDQRFILLGEAQRTKQQGLKKTMIMGKGKIILWLKESTCLSLRLLPVVIQISLKVAHL